jgi:hypothetical protein
VRFESPAGRVDEGKDFSKAPCGGGAKGNPSHVIVRNEELVIGWRTIDPSKEQMCKVSLSSTSLLTFIADGQQFVTLKPLDLTGNPANEFSCGQSSTALNTKAFKIPDTHKSDQYTVQLSWINKEGTFYTCADISIEKRESSNFDK